MQKAAERNHGSSSDQVREKLTRFVHAGPKNCVSIEALSEFLITLHSQAIDIEQIYGYIQRVSQIDM
jgi:hypothetical protein